MATAQLRINKSTVRFPIPNRAFANIIRDINIHVLSEHRQAGCLVSQGLFVSVRTMARHRSWYTM